MEKINDRQLIEKYIQVVCREFDISSISHIETELSRRGLLSEVEGVPPTKSAKHTLSKFRH